MDDRTRKAFDALLDTLEAEGVDLSRQEVSNERGPFVDDPSEGRFLTAHVEIEGELRVPVELDGNERPTPYPE